MAEGPNRYINRELSWLEFNQRVLDEALDCRNPLLERVKFFCIVSSNLDEFFEVRVAGLKQQVQSGVAERSPDGLTPTECCRAIARRVRRMVKDQYTCWREQLVPELGRHGIRFTRVADLDEEDRQWLDRFYRAEVRPVLTPLSIDPAHPFPQLLNKRLNLIVQVRANIHGRKRGRLAVVEVPRILPRLIELPRDGGAKEYVFLGNLIGHYLADLFPGMLILGHWLFRVTRNSELYLDEEDVANLLSAVETRLHRRLKGEAVRLEVERDCPIDIRDELLRTLHLDEDDLYVLDGPLNPTRLMTLCPNDRQPELHDPPFLAPAPLVLRDAPDLFAAIRDRDILLHHPYESFECVVGFLQQAATDPRVLAIKQTLYRTGGDARIIGALMDAVHNGKQVTAVVELKARFDEANNIEWSRQLEQAGVYVVYGLVGLKIHCKVTLVVRRDDDGIRRYLHLSTGNYNPTTAKLYTDIGLLTCHPDFGEDATCLFNLLTGICQFQETRKFVVAPFELHDRMLALIRREADNARRGLPARIVAKMNSLVDRKIIDALYEASQAGVRIDLVVRGICCLRAGQPGLSETITVRSIVGRFLEHSRIFAFHNACRPEVWLSSADWMPRNFFKRIEVAFPIEDGNLRDRVLWELDSVILGDTVKARALFPDGSYQRVRVPRGAKPLDSQAELIRRALEGAASTPGRSESASSYPKVRLAPRPRAKAGS
ncbi:MAG: polyphosphate kinase 1 [Verrucomicrobia bacterium]|jgi:polyphosphate kinase|nr:polyphosphate kinase 1 [Verrucomicrobiota bacterium]OQC66384.1 MAG: Polyphosphate kinase [Verrucomicrobia bacterium ADurb.Bin006]MDI9379330.1 polyphosphate kinase 1 [Verrucomicrobiota bacterium]NMD21887.1 polyphosphate kinase 1 [Verrucomicrobiota bacterium]HNV00249.1 polyphosphate kinase 1 [Verrucomicrobiota bacterium]